ncbi:MAG: GFA family protein [Pseudomonadota bacterium]
MEPATHTGSCMCGTVQFSFSGKPRFVAECVCHSCRTAHGASAVPWVGVKSEQFRIEQGTDSVKWYASSPQSERGFCIECGTRMFFRSSLWAGETHMTVSNMHPPHNLVPTL